VLGLDEDLLLSGEIPTLNGSLTFNIPFGLVELLIPFLENIDALLDDAYGFVWFLPEDWSYVDLRADLSADLTWNGVQKLLHLVLVLVDVSRNRPNEFKAVEEWRKCFFDDWQLSIWNIFELTLQGCEELHEILGLGMELLELSIDLLEVLKTEAIIAGILVTFLHDLEY